MKYAVLGLVFVVVWITIAFGAKVESGWAHVPLAVGVVFLAVGIVQGGNESADRDEEE